MIKQHLTTLFYRKKVLTPTYPDQTNALYEHNLKNRIYYGDKAKVFEDDLDKAEKASSCITKKLSCMSTDPKEDQAFSFIRSKYAAFFQHNKEEQLNMDNVCMEDATNHIRTCFRNYKSKHDAFKQLTLNEPIITPQSTLDYIEELPSDYNPMDDIGVD